MSPRKLRLVVGLIKKMTPMDAVEKLPFAGRRAGGELSKVIRAALANARNQGASDTTLVFKEIQIGEGPRLKRGRAASRGRYHPYKKRMSHIRVVLVDQKPEVKKEDKVAGKKEAKAAGGPEKEVKTVKKEGKKGTSK